MSRWPQAFAFVIKFPAAADPERGPFAGRVEHVASGRVLQFTALEELREFVARTLAQVRSAGAAEMPEPPSASCEVQPQD